jgi:hypothetical protein
MPRLAPPGAGLPGIERFVANRMIRWKARRTSREEAAARFARERGAMRDLVRGRDPAVLAVRVLIKRLPGLEDSSRYWSLLMVIDHVRIVNDNIAEVIACLTAGTVPARKADIARVKPAASVGPEVIVAFETSCDRFADIVAGADNLETTLTFDHPWFGPMDAATWHFMAGFHMQLHRRQMERIREGMGDG